MACSSLKEDLTAKFLIETYEINLKLALKFLKKLEIDSLITCISKKEYEINSL